VERAGHTATDDAILLDIGQGVFGSLYAQRDPATLTAIAISHEHGDHHVDLIPLRHMLRYGYDRPRSIELFITDELRHRYDVFCGEDGFLDDLSGPPLEAGTRDVGLLALQSQPVTHSRMSFAFRVSERERPASPGLVYSGDCGRADDLLPVIRPGDTLLCEAFWSTREPGPNTANHLTAREAARVAERGQAGRLVLTHVLDSHDPEAALRAAREVYRGPVVLAEPGLTVEIGSTE
jgi:ribonuclease BN (tRNA processing enzyme)